MNNEPFALTVGKRAINHPSEHAFFADISFPDTIRVNITLPTQVATMFRTAENELSSVELRQYILRSLESEAKRELEMNITRIFAQLKEQEGY